jgi:hypothetical protein
VNELATKKKDEKFDPQGYYVVEGGDIPKSTTGYPINQMWRIRPEYEKGHVLTPKDHFKGVSGIDPVRLTMPEGSYLFMPKDHFIRDFNDKVTPYHGATFVGPEQPTYMHYNTTRKANEADGVYDTEFADTYVAVFSGSTTLVNPFNDPAKEAMMQPNGFRYHDIETSTFHLKPDKEGTSERNDSPISPLQPFMSLHPATANRALMNHYNRTKLPVADAEWRKGFRHIFISRPECYIMAKGNRLSEQCENDEDFYSAYKRVPHILNLLSPVYVTGTFHNPGSTQQSIPNCNWNFLLSNRIQGLNPSQTQLSVDEQGPKSIDGFTVIPGKILESEQGSTIELSFVDTRSLEVYETLRLWMMYIYKVHKGILASSFNGYQYANGFIKGISNDTHFGTKLTDVQYTQMHPYDRALDYCASLFDIITNESGTKILYWCKYYGIYPVSVSPGLSNDNNAPLTNMPVSSTFRYQKKKEYSNANLVEFNYNAGIVDDFGVLRDDLSDKITCAWPWMYREDKNNPSRNYMGAAQLFTGAPYIVLEKFGKTISPQLRFISDSDYQLNLGFNNENTRPPQLVAGYGQVKST